MQIFIVQHWHVIAGGEIDNGTVIGVFSTHADARAFAAKNRATLTAIENREPENWGTATEGYSIVVHSLDFLTGR